MMDANAVIDELRRLFIAGATPSRLIQQIVARHRNERDLHRRIQEYFRAGFGVQIVRGLSPSERYDDVELRYAYLNEDVLHEMVQNRSSWQDASPELSHFWLDSLVAKGTPERIQELKATDSPHLVEAWDQLPQEDRATIIRMAANLQTRVEMCHILARLAEQLQQRVVALEHKETTPISDDPKT
jgi:hypothetical protein